MCITNIFLCWYWICIKLDDEFQEYITLPPLLQWKVKEREIQFLSFISSILYMELQFDLIFKIPTQHLVSWMSFRFLPASPQKVSSP